jgi:hypothetical protein
MSASAEPDHPGTFRWLDPCLQTHSPQQKLQKGFLMRSNIGFGFHP